MHNNLQKAKIMDNNYNENRGPKAMRLWFGIFMVMMYVGIGLLLIIANQTFEIFKPAISIVIGVLLCLYGVWRGYRLYKGMN